jgi:hypothetical protein
MKILMHSCLVLLLIAAYLGIGCVMFLLLKRLSLPCPGLITTFLSAVVLACLMLGLLLGAFRG